jgi:cysteinyl-tRNA synthetase
MASHIRLHNTLTRKTEPFAPINKDWVTLYSCGPTVYDFAHIGNLRKFIFDDVLRRTLVASGYDVRHVMNVTDVGHLTSDADEGEDKSEKGARREGKTVREVADMYTQAFKHDMKTLNILEPSVNPERSLNKKFHDPYARATDFVPEQIEMVRLLIDKGYAYKTDEAIYFDVTKLPDYGILTGQKLADKEVGARSDVVTDPEKRNPHDFAVWFFTVGRFADHQMHWDTPWGDGFPGWHLECSAIIHATLDDPIDIHTGGVDHIGTHHPNEMAQTEGAFGHQLSNHWMHSEFILVAGEKMAKSKGNFYILADILSHKYEFEPHGSEEFTAMAFRLLVLQAHYRSELNFTWESLEDARRRLHRLYRWTGLYYSLPHDHKTAPDPELEALLKKADSGFMAAMQDDLGTPQALAIVNELAAATSNLQTLGHERPLFKEILEHMEEVLGLGLTVDRYKPLTDEENDLIAKREHVRIQAQNEPSKDKAATLWAAADHLRAKLKTLGIEVEDTPDGPKWHR